MRKVQRSDIVDYVTYEEERDAFRGRVMLEKDRRRVHLGSFVTVLFEDWMTVRYQIQEMIRAEKIVKEAEVQHEIETYNELLGDAGEIGCTLLIEIDDPAKRAVLLQRWKDLPSRVYARLDDGSKCFATYDARQVGEDRLSSVQYVRFQTNGRAPVAVGIDRTDPDLDCDVSLTEDQRKALEEDLAETG